MRKISNFTNLTKIVFIIHIVRFTKKNVFHILFHMGYFNSYCANVIQFGVIIGFD